MIFRGKISKRDWNDHILLCDPDILDDRSIHEYFLGDPGPFILIALGVIMLVKIFFLKKEGEGPELGV